MRWIAENYFFSPRSQYSYKKELYPHGFDPLTSCMPSAAYSTAPTVTYYLGISREFKSDWVNVGNQMRWIFVRNAVKSGELFFFTAFTAITAFLTKIHRIHRISYENLPKNLDPGNKTQWMWQNLELFDKPNTQFFFIRKDKPGCELKENMESAAIIESHT